MVRYLHYQRLHDASNIKLRWLEDVSSLNSRPAYMTGADLARRQQGGGTLKGVCEWGLGGWVDG